MNFLFRNLCSIPRPLICGTNQAVAVSAWQDDQEISWGHGGVRNKSNSGSQGWWNDSGESCQISRNQPSVEKTSPLKPSETWPAFPSSLLFLISDEINRLQKQNGKAGRPGLEVHFHLTKADRLDTKVDVSLPNSFLLAHMSKTSGDTNILLFSWGHFSP